MTVDEGEMKIHSDDGREEQEINCCLFGYDELAWPNSINSPASAAIIGSAFKGRLMFCCGYIPKEFSMEERKFGVWR